MSDLINLAEIAETLKLNRTYVRDKLVKRADFPRPSLMLSQKCKYWSKGAFNEWLDKHKTAHAR